ncbi:hypothetical protein B0181_00930 [Moraxella caviae]|uniref:ComEC family competence protein n=1 Tax=Moraxella caviae TaxID=34060 RepID=A0A1T0ABG7_9GAMM|nr:ComEC/Rec2 family competence protein [Moraxella caviae]OOR93076.1 hypothetical protein B0181_00930 [Moraxella caviae]STZ10051.1 ComEC family competence protein [Moraxella caviae]VEW12758.1 ComEC family competence protein [Moraxella caviae]
MWAFAGVVAAVGFAVLALASFLPLQALDALQNLSFAWLTVSLLSAWAAFWVLGAFIERSRTTSGLWQVHRLWRLGLRLVRLVLGMVMVGLFIINGLHQHAKFETHTPKQPWTVEATALIDEISDSVYDPLAGGQFRQVARLTDIALVHNAHRHADGASLAANPFFTADEFTSNFDGNNYTDGNLTNENSADNNSTNSNPADNNLNITSNSNNPIATLDGMTVLLNARTQKHGKKNDAFATLADITPHSQIRLTLLIEPVVRTDAKQGFDSYRWLRTRHVHATAQILAVQSAPTAAPSANLWTHLQALRQKFRAHFYADWHTHDKQTQQARAVTLSLLTGDRALIDKDTKDLYQFAGISHLLAISGTHVLFLALILAWCATKTLDKLRPTLYQSVPRWQIRLAVMVVASVLYALFTGFDVPAVRTVYMLVAVACVRLFALPILAVKTLLLVGLGMVWLDMYVLWQAGFWLSFVAVWLLIRYEGQSVAMVESTPLMSLDLPVNRASIWRRAYQGTLSLVRLQVWLFVAMLPISLLLFGKVSLWGVIINLFAVGLFSAVIVPINLLGGVLFGVSGAAADVLWDLSAKILYALHELIALIRLGDDGAAWLYAPFGMMGFALFVVVLGLVLAPKFMPRSAVILPVLLLGFLLQNRHANSPDGTSIYVLKSAPNMQAVLVVSRHAGDGWLKKVQLGENPMTIKQSAWLLLADNGKKSHASKSTHAQNLSDEIKRLGVDSLDGIIVQTASDDLTALSASLVRKFSVREFWQAGRSDRQLATISTQACEAGKTWTNGVLQIRALTGWRQIPDADVWHCAIEIRAPEMVNFQTFGVREQADFMAADGVDMQENLPSDEAQSDTHIDTQIDTHIDMSIDAKTANQLIIDPAPASGAWQLWLRLCQPSDVASDYSYSAGIFPSGKPTLWLMNEKLAQDNQTYAELYRQHRVQGVLLTD